MVDKKIRTLAAVGVASFALLASGPALSASAGMIKKGKALFQENCQICHQADAIGEPGTAPSLTNPELLSIVSDKYLLATIRDGRAGTAMMPFDFLGRKDVRSIVAYLRSHETLPNRAEAVNAEPESHGDPRLGKQWYDDICSTCHGVAGDGYLAGGTGTAIGYPGLLAKASDGFLRETIRNGRSNTRMLGFTGPAALANLSDQEIDDIIAYLRSLGSENAAIVE
ncbi:MAG: c-type cytochrome [Paracoccaceae bacterium]